MAANCLFCEAELAEGARFCTQCGNKVPLKKNPNRTTGKSSVRNNSTRSPNLVPTSGSKENIAELFQDIAFFCSRKQLGQIRDSLENVSYQDIENQVKAAFVTPVNIHLRKLLVTKYPQQIKKYLEKEDELPESSRLIIRSC